MNRLIIKNADNTPESVTAKLITKVYDAVLDTANNNGTVELEGNLQAQHAKTNAYEYLTGPATGTKRFPNLSINVTDGLYVSFDDPLVEQKTLNKWGNGAEGMTIAQLGQITTFSSSVYANSDITSFNEFKYFGVISGQQSIFQNCPYLTSIEFPSNATAVPGSAFVNDVSLTRVKIDNTQITSINAGAFGQCTSLETLVLPNTCTQIQQYAFQNCSSLSSINLSNITYMSEAAFQNCTSLQSVDTSSLQSVNGRYIFEGSGITSADLSSMSNLNYNTQPGMAMFRGCTHLTSLVLSSSMTKLPEEFCKNCSSLANVNLSNIVAVGDGAFQGCSSLTMANTHLDFSNFTYFGSRAFADCTGLTGEVTINIIQSQLYGGTFANTGFSKVKIVSSTITHLGYSPGNVQYSYSFQSMPNVTMIDATECSALTNIGRISSNPNLEWMLWPTSAYILDSNITCNALNVVVPTTNLTNILSGNESVWYEFNYGVNPQATIYVPDSVLSQYTSSARYSTYASHFKGMSELPANIKTIYNIS